MDWNKQFKDRINNYKKEFGINDGFVILSIKIRPVSGCFHEEHSPEAYKIINKYLQSINLRDDKIEYIKHESGPEILVILALTTTGLTLTKSIIDLITTIIKSRNEGIKKGDSPSEPIELIIRGQNKKEEFFEEKIVKIPYNKDMTSEKIKKILNGIKIDKSNKKFKNIL